MYEDIAIAEGVAQFHGTANAILLDVRTPEEFAQGHIPGACNVELALLADNAGNMPSLLAQEENAATGFDTPLFVYCTVGYRAHLAATCLRQAGFANVTNIGGIQDWHGDIAR